MLLGIVLHAALSFFPSMWMVADTRQSSWYGLLVAAIHGFRMPLFFVMSGFFSAMLLSKRGRGALVKHRFFRVFLPLLVGMVTIVPLTNIVSVVAMSGGAPRAAEPTAPAGGSTLWAAAEAGDLPEIERHLASGADVNGKNPGLSGATPIIMATLRDQAEAIDLLVSHGADVNAKAGDGGAPLHAAAFLGNDKALAKLVEHGANVNAPNGSGQSPLDLAVVDEGTTKYYASMLSLPLKEENLSGRKAAIAATLKEHGAQAGRPTSVVNLLMQMPLFNHLWFLWFLWLLVLGYAGVSLILGLVPGLRLPSWLVLSPARYLWLIPLTMIPQWFMGAGAEALMFGPDTSAGLIPIPHVLAYYAVFFGFGALYYGYDDPSGKVGNRWLLPIVIALLGVFPLGLAVGSGWTGPGGFLDDATTRKVFGVFLQAVYPWLLTFGLMGLFRRICASESPRMRYLSDSAYWLYLTHLPLVIAAQHFVRDWPLPAFVKFALIVVVVTVFLLWTYQSFVRYTWLGRFLNGPRTRPAKAVTTTTTAAVA